MKYKTLIIDGSWLAFSRWKKSEAMGTPNLNGVIIKIVSLIKTYDPGLIYIAWDTEKRNNRKNIYEKYKNNRKPKDKNYIDSLEELRSVLSETHVDQAYCDGFEGDDVIYSLAIYSPKPALIYTCDKDMLQIITEDISVLKPIKNKDTMVTVNNCKSITKLSPNEWYHYLTIRGDSSDNIPGVRGIGDVAAMDLIRVCPDIVDVIIKKNIGQIDSVRSKLYDGNMPLLKKFDKACSDRENVKMCSDLVSLKDCYDEIKFILGSAKKLLT